MNESYCTWKVMRIKKDLHVDHAVGKRRDTCEKSSSMTEEEKNMCAILVLNMMIEK